MRDTCSNRSKGDFVEFVFLMGVYGIIDEINKQTTGFLRSLSGHLGYLSPVLPVEGEF